MAVIAAAGITAGATLLGAGIQLWANEAASKEALRENRRAEGLRIKFAGEETEREERRFEKKFKLNQSAQNFNMMDTMLKNTQSMFQSNRENTQMMAKFNRSRQ